MFNQIKLYNQTLSLFYIVNCNELQTKYSTGTCVILTSILAEFLVEHMNCRMMQVLEKH